MLGRDILVPPDLERIFGLPGGVSMNLGGPLSHSPVCTPLPRSAFIRREDSGRDHDRAGTDSVQL